MAKVGPQDISDIREAARQVEPGAGRVFETQIAEKFRISSRHARRIIKAVLGSKCRSRNDKGIAKTALTEEQWRYLFGLRLERHHAAWHAIYRAEGSGMIEKGAITAARLNKELRDRGMSFARLNTDRRPVKRIHRAEPNDLGHFDTTKWQEFFVDKDDIVHWAPTKHKNSRGGKAPSLWCYAYIDHESRAAVAQIYKLENGFNHTEFLWHAWSEKENPSEFPLCGVPKDIYMDKGPVNQSDQVQRCIKMAGCNPVKTTPSNRERFGSRKHGRMERLFRTLNEFLKDFPDVCPIPLAELQKRLYAFMVRYNNLKHSSTDESPFTKWLTVKNVRRLPPRELYDFMNQSHIERIVDKDLQIRLDGHLYQFDRRDSLTLDHGRTISDLVGEKVDIYWVRGNYSKITAVIDGYHNVTVPEWNKATDTSAIAPATQTTIDRMHAEVVKINYREPRPPMITTESERVYLPRRSVEFQASNTGVRSSLDALGKIRYEHGDEQRLETVGQMATYLKMEVHVRDFDQQLSAAEEIWLSRLLEERGGRISKTELRELAIKFYEKLTGTGGDW